MNKENKFTSSFIPYKKIFCPFWKIFWLKYCSFFLNVAFMKYQKPFNDILVNQITYKHKIIVLQAYASYNQW